VCYLRELQVSNERQLKAQSKNCKYYTRFPRSWHCHSVFRLQTVLHPKRVEPIRRRFWQAPQRVQLADRVLTQYPARMLLLEARSQDAGTESILNIIRTIWGILTDIFWYGITQWFGRQFAKAISKGPTLEEWQRDLDEKLKQEPVIDPLAARSLPDSSRSQQGND